MLFIRWRRSCTPGTYIHSGYQQEVSYHSCCISDQLKFRDQISFQNPRQMFRSYLWVIHYWSPRWHYWFHTFRRTCVPKKSMPSCFGSLTDITLRVRTGPFLVPRARTGRVPTNEGVFSLWRWYLYHAVFVHQKNGCPFSPSLMGFPHQNS